MKKRGLLFLIGGFIYLGILSIFFYHVSVMANEIEEEAHEIIEEENERLSQLEEDQENDNPVLSDNIGSIQAVNIDEDTDTDNNKEDYQESPNRDNISEDQTENGEIMNEDQFRIMVIFSAGLLLGCLLGNNLTGFIK